MNPAQAPGLWSLRWPLLAARGRRPALARGRVWREPLVSGPELRRQLPERPSVNAVLLHLAVQGLVVGSEKPRRLALVPTGGLEDPVDRPPLGVRHSRLGDLLERGVEERGADRRRLSAECGRRRWVDGQDG